MVERFKTICYIFWNEIKRKLITNNRVGAVKLPQKGLKTMEKRNYKEVRTINKSDLRILCIRKSWYTEGTNEDYMELLKSVENKQISTEDIKTDCRVIVSDLEKKENCFELFEISHTTIERC